MDSKKQKIRSAVIKSNNELYNSYKNKIIETNDKVLTILVVSAISIFGILALISLFDNNLRYLTNIYLFTFVLLLLFFISDYYNGKSSFIYSRIRVILFIITCMSFGAYIGAISNIDNAAVMINVIMICVSIAFINPLYEIYLINALTGIIFLYFSFHNKSYYLFHYDFVNFISSYILTSIISYIVLYLRFELIYEEIEISKLSAIDELTNLYNRKKLYKILENNFNKNNSSLAILDIDDFKKINDTYGHLVGDECLKQLGELLIKFHKDYDVSVARFGGEEFVVTSSNYNYEEFCKTINILREKIEEKIFITEDLKLFITVSIGTSNLDSNTKDYIQLLSFADIALYDAKNNGKNQTKRYNLN
jgi:diguanylate cyclase (GGDEF)-like protein